MKSGILLDVAQPVDAVAHHQAHRAGVIIRPDAWGSVTLLGLDKFFGDKVKRVIPRDAFELARTLRSLSPQRMQKTPGVVLALGIARNFGADHAGRVVVVFCAMDTPDCALVEKFNLKCAG